jgi:uncharacterized protein YbjT (DUF2867 family)
MGKNILIIGAAGNVCIEAVKLLADKDVKLRIACRDPEKAKSMNIANSEFKDFDYLNDDSFKDLFKDVESWLLVSPPSHLNLHQQIRKMVEIAVKDGVKNIVNVSALGIQDDSHPMRQIEQFIEDSGMNYTFIHPNCYMQNFNMYFRQSIVEENSIRLPAGKAKTSFVDLRDVGEIAHFELMRDALGCKTYELTGQEALNLFHIADIFTDVLNRKIEYKEVNEDEYKAILQMDGWYEASIEASINLCRYVKQGWNAVITSGVYDILGKEPRKFVDYVKDYADQWTVPVTET